MATIVMPWGEMTYADSSRDGFPLLFLHGTGCDSTDWAGVHRNLSRRLRLISLDFRGHGQSDVPAAAFTIGDLVGDVLYLLNDLDLRSALLVGHSLGGMVAMEVARRSSQVAGLVLLEGWTSLSAASRAFDTGRTYGTLSEDAIVRIQEKSSETRARFAQGNWVRFWDSVQRFDAYVYLRSAQIPIVEAYGAMGRHERTAANLKVPRNPLIEWIWISNAGHYLPHERPVEVADACMHGLGRRLR